ncbi:hypothetical protein FJ976_19240 [Mesorhizobium sp. B1-1-9]|uniref:hypothetical protein n=1 Tax=Mesorhizobium sp. B1-1-9 TaxID=2589975 RepID=UPI00112C2E29|nr:hypothetical protein [Mesorhizobium sp. B1-1-9]TPN48536.1 hypothetical protein FJ976_19240 [Mesorhizobium sp. B1-1-9]
MTAPNTNVDRLYDLVPAVYRMRDADQGYPLRALLQVIAEQVNLVEEDISRLYDNWFIETCDDWVVPYIGALIGYQPVQSAGRLGGTDAEGQSRNRIMVPRLEVANTIRYRRRKGTLSLIEELASAVSGWPTRAREFYRMLAVNQNINHLRLNRGRTADLRDSDALENIGGAFEEMARTADVRRVTSSHVGGRANIPDLGVFVWRLRSYTVTRTPAYCYEEESPNCFLFSPLGNDTAAFVKPDPAAPRLAPDLRLPTSIRRRDFDARETPGRLVSGVPFYYGQNRSLMIWTGSLDNPVAAKRVVPANLSDWSYRPIGDQVAVDPELGRMMFAPGEIRKQAVWVSYCYGFSTEMGGGEYSRPIRQPADAVVYRVGQQPVLSGPKPQFKRIGEALEKWRSDKPVNAVIEILDSGVYTEPVAVELAKNQSLQLRSANGKRPVLRLLDWQASFPDSLSISGEGPSWFVLDGVIVSGRGMQVSGGVSGVAIRHSTLVPGWGLGCNCEPKRPTEPSIELIDAPLCLAIEHSIVGAIQIERDEVKQNPIEVRISDSIVDATAGERIAIGASGKLCAFATLLVQRSTIIGETQTHAITLAENSIFAGAVRACRRQIGCIRFCYVPPGSRTPRRYQCQPDLVEKTVAGLYAKGEITPDERDEMIEGERLRVEPEFNSTRYGRPTYCQLANGCAVEITAGADDESEMGAFHDLFQPQRVANLRTRLTEYTPAGANAGIIFAT